MLGGSIHTIKKNTEDFLVGNNEIGLEVNAHKTMHIVMCLDQNAGKSNNMKSENTVIPRLTKIIRSGITYVSRNVISRRFLKKIV